VFPNCRKVGKFAAFIVCPKTKSASASGGLQPDPLTRSSAPGLHWGLCPQTPIIGSCYRDHQMLQARTATSPKIITIRVFHVQLYCYVAQSCIPAMSITVFPRLCLDDTFSNAEGSFSKGNTHSTCGRIYNHMNKNSNNPYTIYIVPWHPFITVMTLYYNNRYHNLWYTSTLRNLQ